VAILKGLGDLSGGRSHVLERLLNAVECLFLKLLEGRLQVLANEPGVSDALDYVCVVLAFILHDAFKQPLNEEDYLLLRGGSTG